MVVSNQQLIEHLKKNTRVLTSPRIEEALMAIDRREFVRPDHLVEAYEDYPLPIGFNQTISQPTVVVLMLELLQPKGGDRILDVGSGSGWTTALLSVLVTTEGSVLGTERIDDLVAFGQANLAKFDLPTAKIVSSGSTLEGEFDKVMINAAFESSDQIKGQLVELLKEGGYLIAPVKDKLILYQKLGGDLKESSSLQGFSFVPFIEDQDDH